MANLQVERNKLDNALLKIKDPKVRWRIVDLFLAVVESLNSRKFDVVILPARRMTCLYVLLLKAGLRPPIKGKIFSDRYLNQFGMYEELKGKKIAIVDDVVVTGNTVKRRKEHVLKNIQSNNHISINVAVISESLEGDVNQEYAELGVQPIRIAEKEVHKLAFELALCLLSGLVPFFTDFPVYDEIKVTNKELNSLLSMEDWSTIDVTPSALAFSDVRSLSLIPSEHLISSFAQSLKISSKFQIFKLRIFVQDDPFSPSFKVVPIVSPSNQLEVNFDEDWFETENQAKSIKDGASLYLLSYAFFEFLKKEISIIKAISEKTPFQLDANYGNLASVPNKFLQHTNGIEIKINEGSPIDIKPYADLPVESNTIFPNELTSSGVFVLGDDLVNPVIEQFKRWFPQDQPFGDKTVCLNDIASVFKGGATSIQASIIIDLLNDIGFAVPRPLNGSRAYRPGESFLKADLENMKPGVFGGKYAMRQNTIIWKNGNSKTLVID